MTLEERIEQARQQEAAGNTMTDAARKRLIADYEREHAEELEWNFSGYPKDSTVTVKYFHILYHKED